MACLINLVTSFLLVSTTGAGTVHGLTTDNEPLFPAGPVVQPGDAGGASEHDEAETVLSVSVDRPALELIGLSVGQAEAVERAVGLFSDAGLQLPPLVVRNGQDGVECGQHRGLHRRREGWSEVLLCSSGVSGFERSVVIHELAHAWAAFELSDVNKAAFQQIRGWEFWRDYERAAWRDNGTEQAAEVIAWGVYDLVALIAIDYHDCDDLLESYRALTGLDPVQGRTTLCEPTSTVEFS